ncbi:MAG: hypothetical protein DWQ47_11450 [Acidobacteria bacterium]|nr:MAG: hypothetical protein DWQ32_13865 [Acidobacteriota bacterium]REJ98191.1 MAG: hypothetical protein DWQ38_16665 [Acidobacteriota bacterium]REK16935.1 MAG: hypothetical protein DWQ43_01710 [Acidobacteriota bacterium]REK42845.1 MAG: hypothetical protein DWQ47_11450 [Acidobacteriota bacterium]
MRTRSASDGHKRSQKSEISAMRTRSASDGHKMKSGVRAIRTRSASDGHKRRQEIGDAHWRKRDRQGACLRQKPKRDGEFARARMVKARSYESHGGPWSLCERS